VINISILEVILWIDFNDGSQFFCFVNILIVLFHSYLGIKEQLCFGSRAVVEPGFQAELQWLG